MRFYIIVLIQYFAFTFANPSGPNPNNDAASFGRHGDEIIPNQRRRSDIGDAPILTQQIQRPNFYFREKEEKTNNEGSPKVEFLSQRGGQRRPNIRNNMQSQVGIVRPHENYSDLQGQNLRHLEHGNSKLPVHRMENQQQNSMRAGLPPHMDNLQQNSLRTGLPAQQMGNLQQNMRTGLPSHGMGNPQQNMRAGLPSHGMGNPQQNMRIGLPPLEMVHRQQNMRTGVPPLEMGPPQQNMRTGDPPLEMGPPQQSMRTGLPPQGMGNPQQNTMRTGLPPNAIGFHQKSLRGISSEERINVQETGGLSQEMGNMYRNSMRALPPQNMIAQPHNMGGQPHHVAGIHNQGHSFHGQPNNFQPGLNRMQRFQVINPVNMPGPPMMNNMQNVRPMPHRVHRNVMFAAPDIRGHLPGTSLGMMSPTFPNQRMMGMRGPMNLMHK